MILNSIKLDPFCALRDTSLIFQPGLNIILGPNEIGKSTVFHAIHSVLFTNTNLDKRAFEKLMKYFIPIDGDTAHITLEFDVTDEHYILSRTWGATSHSELSLASGSIVTDEKKIKGHLQQLLPANEGAFRSVLMTYQSGLTRTLEELREDYPTTFHSLSNILRRAVLETDGVSVDLFRETIEEQYEKHFSRWDQALQRPEGGKGIHDKWIKSVGHILQAYYEKEDINSELKKAITFENELDTLNQEMASINEQIFEKNQFINNNKPLVESIQKRENLRLQIENFDNQLEKYSEVNTNWPVYESEHSKMENELKLKRKKLVGLEIERKNAETVEKNRTLNEQYKRAKKKKESFDKVVDELSKMHELKKDTFESIQKVFNHLETLKTRLAAGKISLKFKPELEMTIKVQDDLNETVEKKLDPAKPLTIKAEGRIKLEHKGL